jgi:predicted permease
MTALRTFLSRLAAVAQSRKHDREIEDEIASHLEEATDEYVARGLSREDARLAAARDFGGITQAKQIHREMRSFTWPDTLRQDVKYSFRRLIKDPGFTLIAVATLALGIGVNTALFSVVNGVLLNPLPYPGPAQLVAVYSRTADEPRASSSYPNFLDWVRDNRSFSDLAAFREDDLNLIGLGPPERVPAEMVSASFFRLLGVQPIVGRTFVATDDQLGAAPMVLISESFWQRKFGSSPTALGQTLTLSGTSYVIIGVIPATFQYYARNFHRSDVYVPIGLWNAPGFRDRKVSMGLDVVGRLKPGVTLERANGDMQVLAGGLADQYPDVNKGTGVTLVPLKADLVGPIRPLLLLLVTAVLFVLLIAGVNVANLLLARSSRRATEVAIRTALGASRSRIVRQCLTESVLLALAGGILGSLTAFWGTKAALTVLPEVLLPRAEEIRVDERVLLFTIVASVVAGVLFGLVPALKASRLDPHAALRERGPRVTGAHHRTQSVFVVVEIALALVLLVGAGLMIRSLTTVLSVDPGFNSDRLLVARVSFPVSNNARPDHVRAVWRQMSQKFETIPGIQAASLSASSVPMTGDFSTLPFWLDGQAKPATPAETKWALSYVVETNYLKVMGIPLERGRFLTPQDNEHSSPVVVIDDQFARRHFGDHDPVGRRINVDILNISAEIVGVVGHVRQWGLDENAASPYQAQCYLSVFQIPDRLLPLAAGDIAIVFRTAGAPLAQVGPIRRALEQVNGQLVMYREQAMDGVMSDRIATRRFSMIVLGIFAALALVMACIGIYGVISHLVGERTHEIAIRLALGAERSEVLRMVLRDGAKMALAGVAIGLGAALGLTRLMASMLFGISAHDPVTVAGVVSLLAFVAFAACYVPARRATRVDPMVALRND